jgi:Ca-activated chloride channel family protein
MQDFFQRFMVHPEYALLLLALLPVCVLVVVSYQKATRAVKLWFQPSEVGFFLPEVKMMLRIAGLFFGVIALMGPMWGPTEQQISKLGREVYVLVDVSASMNTEDLKPTRLEKTKIELRRMIAGMKGDRIGLIVFTSDAYVQCPLTTDHTALMMYLDMIGSYQFGSSGTSFREALLMDYNSFTESKEHDRKVTRAAILISDGEDFGEEYESVVGRMKNAGISVFPVGVGTLAGGQVPDYVKGEKRGYKTAPEGGPAISVLKSDVLQSLADQFGTEYHEIDDAIDNLDPVVDQIQMLSASVMDRETQRFSVNRYQWFLGISLICITLSMFWMPVKRKTT